MHLIFCSRARGEPSAEWLTERFISSEKYYSKIFSLNSNAPKFFIIRQGNPSVFQNLCQILKDSPPDKGQRFVIAQSLVLIQSLMWLKIKNINNLTITASICLHFTANNLFVCSLRDKISFTAKTQFLFTIINNHLSFVALATSFFVKFNIKQHNWQKFLYIVY